MEIKVRAVDDVNRVELSKNPSVKLTRPFCHRESLFETTAHERNGRDAHPLVKGLRRHLDLTDRGEESRPLG